MKRLYSHTEGDWHKLVIDNQPVVYAGRVPGTMNLLDAQRALQGKHSAKIEAFAALMIGSVP